MGIKPNGYQVQVSAPGYRYIVTSLNKPLRWNAPVGSCTRSQVTCGIHGGPERCGIKMHTKVIGFRWDLGDANKIRATVTQRVLAKH